MKRLLFTAIILFITITGFCQTLLSYRYYKDIALRQETTSDNARYQQNITGNNDSSITITVTDLKKDELISSESFKGDEPVGVWKYKSRNNADQRDFSFALVYDNRRCSDTIAGLIDYFADNAALNYMAPKIQGASNLLQVLAKNMRYPSIAVDNGIEGRIILTFTITKSAVINDIVIKKAAMFLWIKKP